MRHGRADYNDRIQDSAGQIPVDEPVFLLRGQDDLAGRAVKFYADMALHAGADPAFVQNAIQQAQAMHLWPHRKSADIPVPADQNGAAVLERPADVSRETLAAQFRNFHAMLSGVVLDFCAYLTGEGAQDFATRLQDGLAEPLNADPNIALALVEGMKDWAKIRHVNDGVATMDWKSKLYPGGRNVPLDQ